ncbi:hypothetical protein LJB81_03450 [Desulfovibrio sp. OttesenSCG-928-M14]|nr:hypothetical protein [Desulfovibrio sp. OttesenSCG-928-M14]
MTQATYTFRVDENLKATFANIAQANDRSGAQLLRDFMRQYVQEHADAMSYEQWFQAKVAEGMKAVDEGRVISNEEAKLRSAKLREELTARTR